MIFQENNYKYNKIKLKMLKNTYTHTIIILKRKKMFSRNSHNSIRTELSRPMYTIKRARCSSRRQTPVASVVCCTK